MKRAILVLLVFGAISNLRADTIYQFSLLDVRISGIDILSGCTATDINDRGIIVGVCNNAAGDEVAWRSDGRRFTELGVTGDIRTIDDRPFLTVTPQAINNDGAVAGWFSIHSPASFQMLSFVRQDRVTRLISFPGATLTNINGINDSGQVVGQYRDANKIYHGFRYEVIAGIPKYTALERPGAVGELGGLWLSDINNNGAMVGNVYDFTGASADPIAHGIVLDANGLRELDIAGAANTWLFGINDQGAIVGIFSEDLAQLKVHGFVLLNGIMTVLNVPGAVRADPFSINNAGQIVGSALFESGGQFERKAFIAKGN